MSAGERKETPPPPMATGTAKWVEFTRDMCATLNSQRCLLVVGDPALVEPLLPLIDEACAHTSVTESFDRAATPTSAAAKDEGGLERSANRCTPAAMPHVLFTTPANQSQVQRCLAVHGRIPFLAIVDMHDDDDEHSFVLDLADEVSVAAVAAFLARVGRGVEPRCRQGAPPPPGDFFEPTHGTVLCEARAAVTSTFDRLIGRRGRGARLRSPYEAEPTLTSSSSLPVAASVPLGGEVRKVAPTPCGAVCVFWSDRCPCCPGVLMLVETIVKLIRCVAARHTGHAASANVSLDFPFLVANIDDNDFSREEWPVELPGQVVPSLVAYTGASRAPVLFTGERLPVRLVDFLCDHCLPSSELVTCSGFIKEEAERVAAKLSIEESMMTIPEDSELYRKAQQAWAALAEGHQEDGKSDALDANSPALQAVFDMFATVRTEYLPTSLAALTEAILTEGSAAAGDSRGASPGRGVQGSVDGDGADTVLKGVANDIAKNLADTVPSVRPSASVPVASHKRQRD